MEIENAKVLYKLQGMTDEEKSKIWYALGGFMLGVLGNVIGNIVHEKFVKVKQNKKKLKI